MIKLFIAALLLSTPAMAQVASVDVSVTVITERVTVTEDDCVQDAGEDCAAVEVTNANEYDKIVHF
jgi:hypothetical protein